ncbi:MAG TPA: peptide ABC transporter substrate-binding protein [Verrucomicrobiae bacterium]|nr:peptide ABC transporter substrate-binding protein [Verrucomicrobiae bacterium]
MDDPQETSSWRRFHRLKPSRKQLGKKARKLELATLRHAHKFLVKRWINVREVRRHMLGWLVLVALLIGATGLQFNWYRGSYTAQAAVPGGTYAEGVVGPLDIVNPLFSASTAELTASRLLFSGLLAYDEKNQLRGELAESWQASHDGKIYTVKLRENAVWHDGRPITSEDVVFTINLIKNPETRSPLRSSWESIDVAALNNQTVEFTLPEAYAPFPHALTFGVVPQHLLKTVQPGLLRESAFSKAPVGSGPFAFRNVQIIDAAEERKVLHLRAFRDYFGGAPQLDRFQLHIYKDSDQLYAALVSNEVNAVSGLSSATTKKLDKARFVTETLAINNGTYVLFRNDGPILKDLTVRQALRLATDTAAIINKVGGALPLHGPIIGEQYASVMSMKPPAHNIAEAERLLDKAGWKKNAEGVRVLKDRELSIMMVAVESGDYPQVLSELAGQWRRIGVKVDTRLMNPEDVQQSVLQPRAYDVLLYEFAIGADPDVYAYWHSSQASQTGLNFANYSSQIVDDALESARLRSEVPLRAEKYKTLTEQWLADIPAIALYRPVLHYATTTDVRSIADRSVIVDLADRFRGVKYWTVEQGLRFTTP